MKIYDSRSAVGECAEHDEIARMHYSLIIAIFRFQGSQTYPFFGDYFFSLFSKTHSKSKNESIIEP
jgi:hypothetical protein